MNTDSSGPDDQNPSDESDKQSLAALMAQFEIEFPSSEACLLELYRLAQIKMECRICQNQALDLSRGGRVGTCALCKKDTWFTAGTILEHMKKPRPRLAAIWLTRKGAILNSLAFSSLLNIAYASAHGILKWLRFSIQNLLPSDAPVVHSSLFIPAFSKRSRETPARERPVAEQAEIEKMAASAEPPVRVPESQNITSDSTDLPLEFTAKDVLVPDERSTASSDFNGEETHDPGTSCSQQERVYNLLSDLPLHFDVLFERAKIPVSALSALLTLLELGGKADRLDGDNYVRRIPKPKINSPSEELSIAIDAFLEFIRVNFRGISRKYLQGYLAAFWCYIDRSRWSSDTLWQKCLRSMPVNSRQTRAYVTPIWVKLLPLPVN